MELGMIGLGKMGGFMAERLVRGGHRVIGLDRDPAAVSRVVEKGGAGADSIEKLIAQMRVGGDADVVKGLAPIFQTLAPGPDKGWDESVRAARDIT